MGDANSYPGTPRWVKVFGVIGLATLGILVVLHITGHAPGEQFHRGYPDQRRDAPATDGARP